MYGFFVDYDMIRSISFGALAHFVKPFDIYLAAGVNDVGSNRLGILLARLPELRRANIEHRIIAAQVQQMTPKVEMGALWQEMFVGPDTRPGST